MKAKAWIMQARQMKTRCGLLLSASDGRLFLAYLDVSRRRRGTHTCRCRILGVYLRSLTATLLLVYYHVSMVRGESFWIHVLDSTRLDSLCVKGTSLV
ncbi:hypothetical protein TRIATDRAFT_298181 [Trichoderma atroviride IMI 206040]|uniref:Uncharacterized protein n=1 Tax=Hypocrea atroviridis (strain ATCC 20476 / IMI 206040) TaxID=452589 RepID=G9NLZ4_HYPAI|nr:uncharacterized protein TRIATDRAFT_298181 [Trichoderma atroviride IMI 206040]EHK47929.1 hypothetical protein TRIATDRAFT_298181 [Trichoderma atroviride IMI 206040]